jgi:hypothetical protein
MKHVRTMIAVPVVILGLVCILPGTASAHSKAPRSIKVTGSYSYTNTVPNAQTLSINSNGTLTFLPESCSGLWTLTGKAFAYELSAGSCDEQVAVGRVKIVTVHGAKKVEIKGSGTYVVKGIVSRYTWKAIEK